MVINNHTFEQMLEMIEFKGWKVYEIIEEKIYLYGLLRDELKEKIRYFSFISRKSFDLIDLCLENAYDHGSLPVSLKIFEGEKGFVCRIRDSGKGFDFKKVQEKYKNREKYFNHYGEHYGEGFKTYNRQGSVIFFENKGTTVNILYFYDHQDSLEKWIIKHF